MGSAASDDEIKNALCRGRSDTGHQLHQPKAGNTVTRVFDEAQQRQHVLDVRSVEKFETAKLDEREYSGGSARSRAGHCGLRSETRPPAVSAGSQPLGSQARARR